MNFGFVKVATFTPKVKVADVEFNSNNIISAIQDADEKNVEVLCFPKLSITSSTCGDLFYSSALLEGAKNALIKIAESTKNKKMLVFVGLPIKIEGKIYDVGACICDGKILGFIPSDRVNNQRTFTTYSSPLTVDVEGEQVVMSDKLLFFESTNCDFTVGGANSGAKIVVDLSADPEYSGQLERRIDFVCGLSRRLNCAYCYANAGDGESTTDTVFSGHSIIVENGYPLEQTVPFQNQLLTYDVDLDYIAFERSKKPFVQAEDCIKVGFTANREINTERQYNKTPFIKKGEEALILQVQAQGLKKRLEHTNAKTVVLGLSGGLDSTLAIIVSVLAVKLLGKPTTDVLAYTMPCFGTTQRTLENSIKLAKALGVTIKKVDITKSVKSHLKDLNHSLDVHDATYENAQARERTQLLMDLANMYNGVVVGTGDLSELALGWATYNGDHMSNYAVNSSIPKTLVRHLVEYFASISKPKLKSILLDILDTPVSPELLPAVDSKISQKTEDLVGPYVLHDFFLYNIIMKGSSPKKVFQIACNTFSEEFDNQTILKWLKTFIRRFFAQQFKRSCMPDGVKATEISFSPRGSFNMPSDAISSLWLKELENF